MVLILFQQETLWDTEALTDLESVMLLILDMEFFFSNNRKMFGYFLSQNL